MIRAIGLKDRVYVDIKYNQHQFIKNYDDTSNMIEFKDSCALDFQNGMITINYSEDSITFL